MDWFIIVIIIVVVIIASAFLLTMDRVEPEGYAANALPSNVNGGRYRGTLVNGRYTFALEDTRMVLYGPSDPTDKRSGVKEIWMVPSTPGNYLVMQSDGNLVLYNNNNEWVWQTETSGKGIGPFTLNIDADGTLSILDDGNKNQVVHTVFNL